MDNSCRGSGGSKTDSGEHGERNISNIFTEKAFLRRWTYCLDFTADSESHIIRPLKVLPNSITSYTRLTTVIFTHKQSGFCSSFIRNKSQVSGVVEQTADKPCLQISASTPRIFPLWLTHLFHSFSLQIQVGNHNWRSPTGSHRFLHSDTGYCCRNVF